MQVRDVRRFRCWRWRIRRSRGSLMRLVRDVVPRDSFYALLAEHGDRIVRDEDFAECYSARLGRPSIPPSHAGEGVVVGSTATGSRIEQAMEAVRVGSALEGRAGSAGRSRGFAPDEPGQVPRPAVVAWQGAGGVGAHARLAQRARAARRAGRADRRLDADARRGRDPGHGRAGPHGVRKLLDAVAGVDADAAGAAGGGLGVRLRAAAARSRTADWREKAERERMLDPGRRRTPSARCARSSRADGLLADERGRRGAPAVARADRPGLRRSTRTACRGCVAARRADRIISRVDPEMRHGRKSQRAAL